MKQSLALILTVICILSCQKSAKERNEISKSQQLIEQTIAAHGWDGQEKAAFEFIFRTLTYRFEHHQGYRYEREGELKGNSIHDILENGQLIRLMHGDTVNLSEEDQLKYTESINSVIYFATLPLKLTDAAVKSEYLGVETVQDRTYERLKITFQEENGGVDFEDEFFYWINNQSKEIDYLAYNYQVNGGGVRFRKAYHKRRVEEVLFQDYVNYKAPKHTPLSDLAQMWSNEQLDSLSLIELKQIKQIPSTQTSLK